MNEYRSLTCMVALVSAAWLVDVACGQADKKTSQDNKDSGAAVSAPAPADDPQATDAEAPSPEEAAKQVPEGLPEKALLAAIIELKNPPSDPATFTTSRKALRLRKVALIAHVDALLERYPESDKADQARIVKLQTLGELAFTAEPKYLDQLLAYIHEIGKSKPTGLLASELAYYSIQAFVMGARREQMPHERRLQGTMERYAAFLEDHPTSEHCPVVRASLIRNALATNQIERARTELKKLKLLHPSHPATARAEGEMRRVDSVGRPFGFVYDTQAGQHLDTSAYAGKVVLLHFWGMWSSRSVEEIGRLRALRARYGDKDLQLIGVNTDTSRVLLDEARRTVSIDWPTYTDYRGLKSEILIGIGVVRIPTYFLIDRNGVLRTTEPGKRLETWVAELVAEPAGTYLLDRSSGKPAPGKDEAKQPPKRTGQTPAPGAGS